MPWQPDEKISALANNLIERRRVTFQRQIPEQDKAIERKHAAKGTSHTPIPLAELKRAIGEAFTQFAEGITSDVLDVVGRGNGGTSAEAATWVKQLLDPVLESELQVAIAGLRGGPPYREELKDGLRSAAIEMLVDAQRSLTIATERATLPRKDAAIMTTSVTDLASIDELVKIQNRRGFNADLDQLFSEAANANESLALLRIDVDHFKKVNDQHGGHLVGDEALVAIAAVLSACVRRKGEAYRVGGDEFAILLPNHTTPEATAVAERVRSSVHAKPITSRRLTVSVSVGVGVYPEHAADPVALQKVTDEASYDAKNRGRNLVRIAGEPPPATTHTAHVVERKQPEAAGWSDAQRHKIRSDYFRTGQARCPNDDAFLMVEDVTSFGDNVNCIQVNCPMCGMDAELP